MRGSDRINFPWKLHRSGDCFWKMSRSVNEDVVNEEMWVKDSRPCRFTEQAEVWCGQCIRLNRAEVGNETGKVSQTWIANRLYSLFTEKYWLPQQDTSL